MREESIDIVIIGREIVRLNDMKPWSKYEIMATAFNTLNGERLESIAKKIMVDTQIASKHTCLILLLNEKPLLKIVHISIGYLKVAVYKYSYKTLKYTLLPWKEIGECFTGIRIYRTTFTIKSY